MSGSGARRARAVALAAPALGGGLALLASTQSWVTVSLHRGTVGTPELAVQGSHASAVAPTLGLAALALVAAVALTSRGVRIALGVLGILLGVAIAASCIPVLLDPLASAEADITRATGIAGRESIAALVAEVASSAWVVIALLGGVIVAAGGLLTAVTARSWPGSAHRYDRASVASQAHAKEASRPSDTIDDWDSLSRGDDPTE